jgi:hypothetical protein
MTKKLGSKELMKGRSDAGLREVLKVCDVSVSYGVKVDSAKYPNHLTA